MSEIPPINSQPPLSGVRKVEREKRKNQTQQQKPPPKNKHSEDDDDDQSKLHIDERV
jgi:hypothetical protein